MTELAMSVPTAAKRYGVSSSTVWAAIERGEVPCFRVGSLFRVWESKIPQHVKDRWAQAGVAAEQPVYPQGSIVYFLAGVEPYVKIGFSNDLAHRVAQLQSGSPVTLRLLAHLPRGTHHDEKKYHRRFHGSRAVGEWFTLTPEIQAEIDRLNSGASI
ncbi:GIY-YIG nuclease family protein [Sphingobium phenoxybenzoativorans]|uniref:GIY-YIG nuclease family protein n=1 Tax=Sphingobium phenoxybenzoativorans TaxID=1592790 RepID=A0A975K378_9SPHN|nr:GIY-YIG nuclease family protein [Sphingobium phenoxybenzoativorans]QUT04085.1 GIY-YIG nuclease family protein [Sphingobium phenoxybenzoativorans]